MAAVLAVTRRPVRRGPRAPGGVLVVGAVAVVSVLVTLTSTVALAVAVDLVLLLTSKQQLVGLTLAGETGLLVQVLGDGMPVVVVLVVQRASRRHLSR